MDVPISLGRSRIDLADLAPFVLGRARVDPAAHDVTIAGRRERLQRQTMKVLVALNQRRGEVVSRDELVERCWDGRIVGDDVINRCISLLRHSARRGGFAIETVPKAGYRILETGAAPGRGKMGVRTVAGLLLLAGFAGGWWWIRPVEQGPPPVPTIALVPIASPSRDPAVRDLARSVDQSMTHMLAESGLTPRRIAALPQSKGAPADFVLSGELHEVGGEVEATIRLDETLFGKTIYSQRFAASKPDVGALPDRIGAQIATNINWTSALMVLDRRHPLPPDIAAGLLKQMTISVTAGNALRAYEIARQIAPRVPDVAIAQLALAFNTGFALGEIPRGDRATALAAGRAAAERARRLAPGYGDVYIPWCLLHSSIRIRECEDQLRRGMRADPNAPFPAAFLSALLHGVGRRGESLELARASLANDPYKPAKLARLVRSLEAGGESEEAAEVYARALRWWPEYPGLKWSRATGILERGDFAALRRLAKSPAGIPWNPRLVSGLSKAIDGKDVAAARTVCTGRATPGADQLCMIAFARLGELDAAFAIAKRIYPDLRAPTAQGEDRLLLEHPGGPTVALLTAAAAIPLQRDPRFIALADRLGLLRYWRSARPPDFCRKTSEPICAQLRGHGT